MILGLILLVLTGCIAFFHFTQGMFSATLSFIIALVAALIAISYHESLANLLISTIGFPEQASAMSLVVIFASVYILLRLLFDKAIPGNVRLPVVMDKVGAAVMGIFAGLIATGIVAIAAQMLPFYPTIGEFNRFACSEERTVIYQANPPQNMDGVVVDEMVDDRVPARSDPEFDLRVQHLILRQDEFVLGIADYLSRQNGDSEGSMLGDQPLSAIHPDYLTELFGQRVGIQVGAKHTIVATGSTSPVTVANLYSVAALPQVDAELKGMHPDPAFPGSPTLSPGTGQIMLVARVNFTDGGRIADDADRILRLSPGSIRIVANQKNYFPVGTVEHGRVVYANRFDDLIFINMSGDQQADFVFLINSDDLVSGNKGEKKAADGTFLEVKRFARVDLSGKAIENVPIPSKGPDGVMRKTAVKKLADVAGGVMPAPVVATAGPTGTDAPVFTVAPKLSNKIPIQVDVHVGDPDYELRFPPKGNPAVVGSMVARQFTRLEITSEWPLNKIGPGDENVQDLRIPDGAGMVQIDAEAPTGDVWAWTADLTKLQVVTTDGHSYVPAGAWAQVQIEGQKYFVLTYDDSGKPKRIVQKLGRPTAITFAFLIPTGSTVKEVLYGGKIIYDSVGLKVPAP